MLLGIAAPTGADDLSLYVAFLLLVLRPLGPLRRNRTVRPSMPCWLATCVPLNLQDVETERKQKVAEYMALVKTVPVLNKLDGFPARRLARVRSPACPLFPPLWPVQARTVSVPWSLLLFPTVVLRLFRWLGGFVST